MVRQTRLLTGMAISLREGTLNSNQTWRDRLSIAIPALTSSTPITKPDYETSKKKKNRFNI